MATYPLLVWIGMLGTLAVNPSAEEDWTMLNANSSASLRGLSVVSRDTVWVSGTEGTVLRTTDGGATWQAVGPADGARLDFRCIRAFSDREAVIASSGDRDVVYRTENGGSTWEIVYEHPSTGTTGPDAAFFDGMVFWDRDHGMLMGDPIQGKVMLLATVDGGRSWEVVPSAQGLTAQTGEAGFAASGTNLCVVGEQGLRIALGGAEEGQSDDVSRVLISDDGGRSWDSTTVPMPRSPSRGIFSIAAGEGQRMIAVGGDYRDETDSNGNIALSLDAGRSWILPTGVAPRGYRSVVCMTKWEGTRIAVTLGPSGGELSLNDGDHWQALTETGFHAAAFVPDGSELWACGSEGRIGKWSTHGLIRVQH